MNKKFYVLLLLSFILSESLSARHIIGGVVSYVCNGGGNYTFTMKIYRDCSDPQAANFDTFAPVTFYRGDDTEPLTTIFAEIGSITDVQPPDENPCIIVPPSVCVEEGIYTFDYTFEEWPVAEPYTLAYQRCCRNNNITNVLEPQETGATFSTTILPAAQDVCNSSPEFNGFPPTIICAGNELEYDHSASDPDGDLIIYELCAPFKGGGLAGILGNPGNTTDCDGVTPNPACPPGGWTLIDYVPPYSALNPIGGTPQMTINSNTGLLTGVPPISGQFVVGVCASEYRNGQLMSVLSRDFQFNVTTCEDLVVVDIGADSVFAGADFYIESCAETNIAFENNSYQMSFIDNFHWKFTFEGQDTFFYNWEPEVGFPEIGSYIGELVLNPGQECNDTAVIFVEIYPETTADFAFDYDTCTAGAVTFVDESSGGGGVNEWNWDFGNEEGDSIQNPFVQYPEAGLYDVNLSVVDGNDCEADTTIAVSYFPVPNLILVSPSAEVTCPPADILFENLSAPIDTSYTTNWVFGDGGTGTDISPTHTYTEVGTYSVELEIISPIGCVTDTTFTDLITVKDPPRAEFAFEEPTEPFSNFSPEITLFDLSDFPVFWEWFDNDEKFSLEPNPQYVFPDTGMHELKLVVYSEEGCSDTTSQFIDIKPEITYYLPNAFTPNWDTKNDLFRGTGFLRGVSDFSLQVWDRYGELIYETDDPEQGWNGYKNNEGKESPSGVYLCVVNFTGPRGEPFEFKSYATLIR